MRLGLSFFLLCLNWGLELYLRILAVKGDSSLALENKPMLKKKQKKIFIP